MVHTVEPRSKAPAYKAMFAYKAFKKNPLITFCITFYIGSTALSVKGMKSLCPLKCAQVKRYCIQQDCGGKFFMTPSLKSPDGGRDSQTILAYESPDSMTLICDQL